MNELSLNYERLRRRVVTCERYYDQIELFDLSHSLRLWSELKDNIGSFNKVAESSRRFKTACPSRPSARILKTAESVFCPFPGHVTSRAPEVLQNISSGVPKDAQPDGSTYCSSACVMALDNFEGIKLKDYYLVKKSLTDNESQVIKNCRASKCNFSQWMGAEVVRVTFLDDDATLCSKPLSRYQVIHRMANAFGGSHTWSESNEFSNSSDRIVRELFKYEVCALPLPYLILLNIGQDILAGFKTYVTADSD